MVVGPVAARAGLCLLVELLCSNIHAWHSSACGRPSRCMASARSPARVCVCVAASDTADRRPEVWAASPRNGLTIDRRRPNDARTNGRTVGRASCRSRWDVHTERKDQLIDCPAPPTHICGDGNASARASPLTPRASDARVRGMFCCGQADNERLRCSLPGNKTSTEWRRLTYVWRLLLALTRDEAVSKHGPTCQRHVRMSTAWLALRSYRVTRPTESDSP